MKSNIKTGKSSEFKFAAKLMEKGITVLQPLDESNDYDFVVIEDDKPIKIQVRSCTSLKKTGNKWRYNINFPKAKKDIDILVCHIQPLDSWYIIPFAELDVTNGTLSIENENARLGNTKHLKYEKFRENWRLLSANFVLKK